MKQKKILIFALIGMFIVSGTVISILFLNNQKIPDIWDFAPYNLTLHTVEGGWILSNDCDDNPIYPIFQENDSNTTHSPRNISEPFLIKLNEQKEHLNNSYKEKNRNFSVLYVEPDSYTDVVIITHTFIEYENFSHIIMPETGFSSNNLYIMPDALRFEGSGTVNSLHFNETSINVSMYENFKIEDYLSHKLSSGASPSPSNIISTQSKVNLSLFPTITFNCIYYFVNYNSSTYDVEIVKTFEFIQARIKFDEFLIGGDLQMGYRIQVFRYRFVFWDPDWFPKGYDVPPWSILYVKKEN